MKNNTIKHLTAELEALKKRNAELEKTTANLKVSEQKYRFLAEAASELICLHEPDGTYTYLSPSVQNLLGYTADELIGTSPYDLISPDDKERARIGSHELALSGKNVTEFEFRIRKKDGSYIWLNTYTDILTDENGNIKSLVTRSRDITEKKIAEKAFQESERKLKLKLDNILSPDYEIDEVEFANIINSEQIQSMMDDFYKLTNIGMGILDMKGNILVATGWQDICTKFHRINAETRKNCLESDIYLTKDVKAGEILHYKCKNNMWDIATPIVVGDKRFGTFFLGQFLYEDEEISYDFFSKQAEKYGFDKKEYLEALERVPRWNKETVDTVMLFYQKFTAMFSRLSYSNLKLATILQKQKSIEIALKESEFLLNQAQKIANVGHWIWDLTKQELTWSDEIFIIFGYTRENFEVTAENFEKTIHPEDLDEFIRQREKALSNDKELSITHRIVRPDGEICYVHETAWIIRDESNNPKRVFGTVLDITDYKLVELALKKSEQRLKDAQKTGRIGHVEFNLIENKAIWADVIFDLYERDPKLGTPSYDEIMALHEPEDSKRLEEVVQLAIKEGKPYEIDLRANLPSKKEAYYHAIGTPVKNNDGQVISITGTVQDVTERKIVEKKLIQSELELKLIINATTDGIWEWNFLTNKLLFSPKYYTMLGYEPNEFEASFQNWQSLIHPDDVMPANGIAQEWLLNKEGEYQNEFRLRMKDGQYIWINTTGKVVEWDENGTPIRMIGNHKNINERKKVEEQLKKFEKIVSYTEDGVALLDRNYRYLIVNNAYERFSGKSKDQLISKTVAEYLGKDIFEKQIKKHFDACLLGESIQYQDWFNFPALGKRFVSVAYFPVYDDSKDVVGLIASTRDITELKETENALKFSEARFSELFNTISSGVAIYEVINDGKTGRDYIIKDFNKSALEMERKKLEEVVGKSLHDLRPNIDDFGLIPIFREVWKTGNPAHYPAKVYIDEKFYNWYENSVFRLPNGEIVAVFDDVTKRKVAEEALKASEERFNLAMNATHDGLFDWNLITNDIYYSPGWKSMLGYADNELKNEFAVWEKLTDPEDVKKSWEMLNEHFAGKRDRFEMEFKMQHKDGHWVDILSRANALFDENGKAYRVVGTHVDITALKIATEALKRSEERFILAVEGTRDGLWDWDLTTNYAYHSDQFARMLDYEPDDLPYTSDAWSDLIHPDDKEMAFQKVDSYLKGGDEIYESTFRLRCKDGTYRWIIGRGKAIRDKSGKPYRFVGFNTDITEQKFLEEQLRQSQKMEAIGKLAGGVAHDFNNLLTVINGHCEMLLSNMKLNKEEYDDILEIKKAGERAASLTRQLLAFSRKQLLQPEVLNINNLIKNVERMLIRIIGEDIELKTFLETQIHNVKADRIQIEQIILNLTVNARDAMPKGGILTIETQNIFLDEAYARIHGEVAIGNYVMLSITDNGIGMDKATRERIFEPFFSTKGINKGTGLGLATVYGIVKQSNGYIWVYSELGKGSSFKIYLPAFEISTSIENDKKEDLVNLMGNETILVVEDEKSVRRIVERTLKEYGYNLICYTDVFKAIEDVKMYKKEIHMLLSDVVMPKLSGVDFYEEIRKFYPEIKVCFMSGYTDESISRHGVLQRGVNFIQKPFSTIELAKKVRKVLDSE